MKKLKTKVLTGLAAMLAATTLTIAEGNFNKSYADEPKNKTSQSGKLLYPLISVPDEGTILDEAKASKVRQLAKYIFTTRDPRFNSLTRINPNSIEVTRVMELEGSRYAVSVLSFYNRNLPRPDGMAIITSPIGENSDENRASFLDVGLDARVDEGMLTKTHPLNRTGIDLKLDREKKIGLQNQSVFDGLYMTIVDKLHGAYVTKRQN